MTLPARKVRGKKKKRDNIQNSYDKGLFRFFPKEEQCFEAYLMNNDFHVQDKKKPIEQSLKWAGIFLLVNILNVKCLENLFPGVFSKRKATETKDVKVVTHRMKITERGITRAMNE